MVDEQDNLVSSFLLTLLCFSLAAAGIPILSTGYCLYDGLVGVLLSFLFFLSFCCVLVCARTLVQAYLRACADFFPGDLLPQASASCRSPHIFFKSSYKSINMNKLYYKLIQVFLFFCCCTNSIM